MFCFVVLLMDGIVLVGFTKSILCRSGLAAILGYGRELGPPAQPLPSSRCAEVILPASGFFWVSICERLFSPSGAAAGETTLEVEAGKADSCRLNFHDCCWGCNGSDVRSSCGCNGSDVRSSCGSRMVRGAPSVPGHGMG